jgi:hypothetical protein
MIIGVLMTVMFQVYATIGKIAVYGEQMSRVHQEALFLVQTLQNTLDDASVTWTIIAQNKSALRIDLQPSVLSWLTLETWNKELVRIEHKCQEQWQCWIVLIKEWKHHFITSLHHVHVPFIYWYVIDWGVWLHTMIQSREKQRTQSQGLTILPVQTFFRIMTPKE